ncbi:MAG: hypothetical protein ACLP7Q_10105 [Isosphaeraceae bacterium]
MISITRHAARRLRAVFRRSVLGISHKGLSPPLVLHAEGQRLRAQYQYHDLAVEYTEPGSLRQLDSIPVPLEALADIEGRDNSPVVLEAVEPDRTIVRWQDRGIPRTRAYPVTPFGKIAPFPETPTAWTGLSADVLAALAEASATCTGDSPRYALDCVQLRGTGHKIIATDGCQLLVRSGFGLPWDGDLLIRGSPIFACKAFVRDKPIQIGKTDSHIVLRIGPWTTYHEIQKDGRFPRVEDAIPETQAVATRVQLDHEDARFLETALARLPGSEVLNSPATLEMNGKVVVRARGAEQAQITELVLNRSSYSGPPIRINSNRAFLSRALRLGFSEIGVSGVETPVVCRNEYQIYAWQPLTGHAAIEPTDNVIRIESSTTASEARQERTLPVTPRSTMRDRARNHSHDPSIQATDNGHVASESPGASLATLIRDAESLHATLTEAKSSLARLITGLRRHRKQSRLLNETLRSIRQLKLTESVE